MIKIRMSMEQKRLWERYSKKMLIPIVIPYLLFFWYLVVEIICRFQIDVLNYWGMFFLLFVPFLSIIWIVMQKVAQPENNIKITKKLLFDYWSFMLPLIMVFFCYSLAIGTIYIFVLELLMALAVSCFFAVLYEIGYRIMQSALLPLCFLTAYTLNSAVPIVGWAEKFSFLIMLFQSRIRFVTILVYAMLAMIGYLLCIKKENDGK